MADRLSEIEHNLNHGCFTWGEYCDEHYDADDQVEWLIAEVKRLRYDNARLYDMIHQVCPDEG